MFLKRGGRNRLRMAEGVRVSGQRWLWRPFKRMRKAEGGHWGEEDEHLPKWMDRWAILWAHMNSGILHLWPI